MSAAMKRFLIILGVVAAAFILSQLVMGQLIVWGRTNLIKAHQHSGYTTVVLVVVYLILSLRAIASMPVRTRA